VVKTLHLIAQGAFGSNRGSAFAVLAAQALIWLSSINDGSIHLHHKRGFFTEKEVVVG
jgi:hypothetical protein